MPETDIPLSDTPLPFTITPEAIQGGKRQLREATARGEAESPIGLRIGVRGGGCSGYSYVFDLATKLGKRDRVWNLDGLHVVVDSRSERFLAGATLAWEQKLMGYGFKWENPNAADSCGCGQSFDLKEAD